MDVKKVHESVFRDEDEPDESSRPLHSPEVKHPPKPKADQRPESKPDKFHAKIRRHSAETRPPTMAHGAILPPKVIKPSLPPEARRPPKQQDVGTSQITVGPRVIFKPPTTVVNEKKTHLYPPRHATKVPLQRYSPPPPNRERKPPGTYDKPWLVRAPTRGALPPRRERVRTVSRMKRASTQYSVKRAVLRDGTIFYTTEDAVRVYNNKDKTKEWSRRGLSRPDTKGFKREATLAIYTDPLRKIPPWHRKEYVLTRNEVDMYNHIHDVYGNGDHKKVRAKKFYDKLEELQLEKWKKGWDKELDKRLRMDNTKRNQQRQLKHVRDKFEEDRYKRYMSQYVTTRVLDYEWATRHVYGLPEDINEDPQNKVKLKRRKSRIGQTFDTDVQHKKNKKRYDSMFNVRQGPDWDKNQKRPKMAGVDTVELDDGGKQNITLDQLHNIVPY